MAATSHHSPLSSCGDRFLNVSSQAVGIKKRSLLTRFLYMQQKDSTFMFGK